MDLHLGRLPHGAPLTPTPGENSPVPVKTAMSEIPVQMAATPAAKEMQAQGPYCDEEFH